MDTPILPPLPLVAELMFVAALSSTWALPVPVWCARDLGPGAEAVIRERLRARTWVPLTHRIYRARSPILSLFGQAYLPQMAAALARQNGWRLMPSRQLARYAMLTGDRPLGIFAFTYDGERCRAYRGGLVLEPVDPAIAALSVPAQMVVLGLGDKLSGLSDREIDTLAAQLAPTPMWRMVREHARQHPFAGTDRATVSKLIDAIALHQDAPSGRRRADRQAPAGWVPPPRLDGLCRIEDWWLEERLDSLGTYEVLRGRVFNHPYVDPMAPYFLSSPVVWIDIGLGWARAESRLYHLGEPLWRPDQDFDS